MVIKFYSLALDHLDKEKVDLFFMEAHAVSCSMSWHYMVDSIQFMDFNFKGSAANHKMKN